MRLVVSRGGFERDLGAVSRVCDLCAADGMPGPAPSESRSGHGQMSEPVIQARALGPVWCGASRKDVLKVSVTAGMMGGWRCPLRHPPHKPPVLGHNPPGLRPRSTSSR